MFFYVCGCEESEYNNHFFLTFNNKGDGFEPGPPGRNIYTTIHEPENYHL